MKRKEGKRGPKPIPDNEKKVRVSLWVKKKYVELAEIELAKMELKFEDEKKMNRELARYVGE